MSTEELIPPDSVAIIHTVCGGIAFRYDHVPHRNEPTDAEMVVWPKGWAVPNGPMMCHHCGASCWLGELIPEGGEWAPGN